MDTWIAMFISFVGVIIAGIGKIIITFLKKKIFEYDRDYYLKRYEFYRKLYVKYCIKNLNYMIFSIQLNNDFINLYDRLSNDVIYISPKLRKNFLNNRKCLDNINKGITFKNFIYNNWISHSWYVATIISQIYKEYTNCCSVLGYKTYKTRYYITNFSLFFSIMTITFIYSVPKIKVSLSFNQYWLSVVIAVIIFIISSLFFVINKDYFARY